MKNWLTILILCTNLNNICFAEDSIVAISKGQSSPFDGILFPREAAIEARNAAIDRDRYKLLTESFQQSLELQTKNIGLQEQRIKLFRDEADDLSVKLKEATSMNSWERVGLFVLGVVTTIGAGYAISKAAR